MSSPEPRPIQPESLELDPGNSILTIPQGIPTCSQFRKQWGFVVVVVVILFFYYYFEREWGGAGRERGRERIPSRLLMVNAGPNAGLHLMDGEIVT